LRKTTVILLAAASLLAGVTLSNAAPTQAQQQAIRSSCQSDYRAHCASVPTGGSAALQCLEQNLSSLSSSCQQAVRAATGGASSSTSGGGTTTSSGSSSTSSGGSSSTSSGGGSATSSGGGGNAPATVPGDSGTARTPPVIIVLNPGQEIRIMREACGRDYRNYCGGVRIVGGAALSCLVSHASSLSSSCKSMLSQLGQRF
jgi:cobalamin biosynthesis Mg chelatase CobN